MGFFTKVFTNIFTKSGVRINDGEYFYQSSSTNTSYDFSVRDNGTNIIITNTLDGAPDFLVYHNNGKYKNSFGAMFSFEKIDEGVYRGGLMGKNMGIAKLITKA